MASPQQPVQVFIADDHPLMIDGIKLLLSNSRFLICGEATAPNRLAALLHQSPAELLILDLNMSGVNMVESIGELKALKRSLRILVFSSYNTPSLIRQSFQHGADGYLLKDTTRQELLEALEAILVNDTYVGKTVDKPLLRQNESLEVWRDAFAKKASLSDRELEIIRLIVVGNTSKEIGEVLFISPHTVQTHRKNILRKLDLHSGADLIRQAYALNLV